MHAYKIFSSNTDLAIFVVFKDVRKMNFAVIMQCVSLRIKDAMETEIVRILLMKKTAVIMIGFKIG